MKRLSTCFAVLCLVALSTFAQSGYGWRTAADISEGVRGSVAGTVVDVDEGSRRLQLELDADNSRVTVETDSVSTQYNGFGSMIAGKPEIFVGSKGFSNIRLGDRVELRGNGRGRGSVMADTVTLLGRSVPAAPTGVGDTRAPASSATTQIDRMPSATVRASGGTAEGTVRQINVNEGRLVIQTGDRRLITIRASRNTPVIYRNETYPLRNLEVGDRIRVEADTRDTGSDEITATRITVLEDVNGTPTVPSNAGTVTVLEGQVTRTDSTQNVAWLATRDDEVRIDMSRAEDANGTRIGARDLRTGETLEVTGSFDRAGDIFLASTVRYTDRGTGGGTTRTGDDFIRYGVVTINGTVTETLDDETTIGIRDRATNRVVRLWATDDFIVRLKTGTTTADKLKIADNLRVKAYQDSAGNLIAQTITVRNR